MDATGACNDYQCLGRWRNMGWRPLDGDREVGWVVNTYNYYDAVNDVQKSTEVANMNVDKIPGRAVIGAWDAGIQ